jgi:hypothetical protein
MFDRIAPFLQMAAEVSSQEDSIARTVILDEIDK